MNCPDCGRLMIQGVRNYWFCYDCLTHFLYSSGTFYTLNVFPVCLTCDGIVRPNRPNPNITTTYTNIYRCMECGSIFIYNPTSSLRYYNEAPSSSSSTASSYSSTQEGTAYENTPVLELLREVTDKSNEFIRENNYLRNILRRLSLLLHEHHDIKYFKRILTTEDIPILNCNCHLCKEYKDLLTEVNDINRDWEVTRLNLDIKTTTEQRQLIVLK